MVPITIIFALLLNYITNVKLKKVVQMVTYAPHFISTVVYCGMILIFLSSDGVINQLLKLIGIDSVAFLTNPSNFRHYKRGCIFVSSAGVLMNYLTAFVFCPLY